MTADAPRTIHLQDYRPTPYLPQSLDLDFALAPRATRVTSRTVFEPNPQSRTRDAALELQGEKIKLISLRLDGRELGPADYTVSDTSLRIAGVPQRRFQLEITTECDPVGNTALSGLYQSNGIYCTQCEAEGFRRITYFYDRPDVMTVYTVRIEADAASHPILLSNGNLQAEGPVEGTARHYAVWHDPHPKPSYLFALVAGDLAGVHDSFTTQSGRPVALGIYVEKGKEDRCAWAMESLKASMRWDEERFGREYDLEVFNIVAVSDFNMGAMENKGLNIFNDKYILALPETATDLDYTNIEAIIAHEYFHNWTGNRITCRDWFQLCLKEGLTVFRDQEFSSDLRSRAVKRITDVKTLRARQFPEDAGPLSHPVRPSSYIEINNFYTATVYEKGAEICRMMMTLIGEAAFRKGIDLYFDRFDGTAATVENFVACMAEAGGRDLTQFFTWYEQAGTPRVTAESSYDAAGKTFTLVVEQETAATPGQEVKVPLHMPLALGLVGRDGQDIPLVLDGGGGLARPVIELTSERQTFRFVNVPEAPVLSLNRGFSAPVTLQTASSAAQQQFLMGHDSDPFNRWEAGQARARQLLLDSVSALLQQAPMPDFSAFALALRDTLKDTRLDMAFKALMLGLPSEAEMAASLGHDVDTDVVYMARLQMRQNLSGILSDDLQETWRATAERGAYAPTPEGTGRRALRYAALHALSAGKPAQAVALMRAELAQPANMTAEIGTITAMIGVDDPSVQAALDQFYDRHQDDHLLVDKWFGMNALVPGALAARRVEALKVHPAFKLSTPNRVYALIGGFTAGNTAGFNAADGAGYRLLADTILALDKINPQVAARMATGFRSWRLMNDVRRAATRQELERILAEPRLSRDSFEIVSRTLKG
jgi:aminopeptidase N